MLEKSLKLKRQQQLLRWSEELWRSAGSRGRRLAAEATQQTGHLQQGVDAFSHPHVSVTNLLKHDTTSAETFIYQLDHLKLVTEQFF